MLQHHKDSLQNLIVAFEQDATVLALILGGSIAHGFEKPDSDIDVSIVVDTAEYQKREREGRLHYNNRTLCTYETGYIDGKYVDLAFLGQVATRGSDPARYAYQGSRILFSRVDGLTELLLAIGRYPVEHKQQRIERFVAQLLAWRWYYSEGVRQESEYLIILSLQKLILFGSRIILAENELLFPYHKWLLRVLQSAERKPPGIDATIQTLLSEHSWQKVAEYCEQILAFVKVDPDAANAVWPSRFMQDTELRWLSQESSIDDI